MAIKKRKHKFGLQKKLTLFTTSVAFITFSSSAFFLYVVRDLITVNEHLFTIGTLILGIIWSGILTYFGAFLLTKPLERLKEAAIRASEGDISANIQVSKSDDEINALGIAFNEMLESFRTIVTRIEDNFNETNHHVMVISEKSQMASTQAESASRTVAEISAGAENSAMAIQTTAESIDAITRIAQEVQSKAKESERISERMMNELQENQQVIQSLVSGIEDLAKENNVSLEAVSRLEQNATQVEQIIQLVGDIAEQTNLLALNASIEAARAGEHGKGFAVVADEVRKLADESATAVQGISELIQSIQNEVSHVVRQISEQVKRADQEAEIGMKTSNTFAEMTETIHQSAVAVESISQLVDEQMESVHQTSSQAQEVAAIAEETSAGSEEVARISEKQAEDMEEIDQLARNLKEQATNLKTTISRFTI